MADSKPLQAGEGNIVQLVIFKLGEQEFGVGIGAVREIIRTGAITRVPDSPEFMKGVINVRGEIAAAIDLKARFFPHSAKQHDESKHILIIVQENNLFGVLVGEVTEVLRVAETRIKPPPELITRVQDQYVSGVITVEDRLIILLDLPKVLSIEQLAGLAEAGRKAGLHMETGLERAEEQTG